MFESASALFSIADAGEFRFARFYIVCEEVPLGTPESPLIVCSLSDTLRECPNVAKTRNGMPDVAWKKYTNFASQRICCRPFYPELSGICFSEYSSSPILFSVTAGDYGDVPDRTPRLPDALHCAWRAACRRSCGRARALHRPLR